MGDELLKGLIRSGIKACKIAQSCREEETLFKILVQEKGRLKSNDLDFKTLADVFIQQVAIFELEKMCSGIASRIYGEENNQFTNKLGETITVVVKENLTETTKLLSTVLDNNKTAARLLAEGAHNEVCNEHEYISDEDLKKVAQCGVDIDNVGIWIDPIDGTSQYVKGYENQSKDAYGVCPRGLDCVTVLMGAYNINTGLPIIGMIFQPFSKKIDSKWRSRCFWGVSYGDLQLNNISKEYNDNVRLRDSNSLCDKPCVVASCHDNGAQEIITQSPFNISFGGGAGYKCLCVIEGLVDAFFYSDDTCYKWDTCAPHAILLSLGGGIAVLKDAAKVYSKDSQLSEDKNSLDNILRKHQILYNKKQPEPISPWCNSGGIIAYTSASKSRICLDYILKSILKK